MFATGLSKTQETAFHKALVTSRGLRIRLQVLDMDQNVLSSPIGTILSGQVDIDATADITRSADLTVLDVDNELNLDNSGVFSSGLFLDRMIRIFYGVKAPGLDRWVDIPIFTGPIVAMGRDDAVVTLSALGKESLLMGPASTHRTWAKGSYKSTVLRELLAGFGERFMAIPHQRTKTTKVLSIAPETIPWDYASSIARSWGAGRIMYDGRGYAAFRGPDSNRVWTFRGGVGGSILSPPKVAYDITEVRNFVVVTGAIPSGSKVAVQDSAHAPVTHPFSARNLGRDNRYRYLREDISDDTITTKAEAKKLANSELNLRMASALQLDFASLVIPTLEPLDMIAVDNGTWVASSLLEKFTIPLVADGTMSIGRKYAVRGATRRRVTGRKGPRR